MCTALILGVAQLGMNMATSYMQYKQQKDTLKHQENVAKEQANTQREYLQAQAEKIEEEKEIKNEINLIENEKQEREDRQKQAEIRANAAANGTDLSGSNYDYLSQTQYMQDLNDQQSDLSQQIGSNNDDWRLTQNQHQQSKNDNNLQSNLAGLDMKNTYNNWSLGSSLTGQILGNVQSLV